MSSVISQPKGDSEVSLHQKFQQAPLSSLQPRLEMLRRGLRSVNHLGRACRVGSPKREMGIQHVPWMSLREGLSLRSSWSSSRKSPDTVDTTSIR